uniref:Cdc23 domain-containing protein n=1 Tax=Oryza punctata TaxID=4537 RepID=A0A0E0LDL7_ORYPU
METLMVDRVHGSLRLFMHRNAVFLCERLCAQFPAETNVQLLATCYLHNNQPYAAYHILKGKKLPESRYLFAMSCFRMNLLREAEEALCPVNEPNIEVPSGATGHYLLGVIYRYTGRVEAAAEQFVQALTLDPLLWAAYEELCILGVAEDANECFSEATALRLQQELTSTSNVEKSNFVNENRFLSSNNGAPSNLSQFDTPSPTSTQASGIAPPPLFRNMHAYQNTTGGNAPSKPKVNAPNLTLRRKYIDEAGLKKVGKTYFELVNYLEADHFFELAHRLSPCTLEGMDIYSTVLYHLNEEMRLSYLAQDLVSIDRLSPQAWCAVGNCFALRKDHETALKNFQRAVQLDSRVAYAHTLCGHEYSALEDYENSIKLYRSALQVDERHYNAWYGLGVVYLRQEKFEFAEHHFRRAFQINPCSSVLMCYLGMALHALKRNEEALEMMEKAIFADKKNPLPKYQKALILLGLQKYPDALDELERLKEIAPHESSMYALMGKIYKQLNILDKAVFCFGIALDLKPPAADVAIIKSAMEKVHLPDELMDDDDDDEI